MQQKPKTTVKAKVKVKAKPKPTKATNKALRKEVIGKLKEKVVQTNAAPKMGMGSKGMPKMKSGCGSMKKYADGTGKVKAPSTAAKKDNTTSMVAKRRGVIVDDMKSNDKKSYRNRQNKINEAAGRKGNTDYIVADAMANSNYYGAEARAEKAARDARKLKADKTPMSNTYAKGSKMVKCEDGKAKVKAPSTAAKRASTATAMPAKRRAMTKEEEIAAIKKPSPEYYEYDYDTQKREGILLERQNRAKSIKKAEQNIRDKALERAVSGKMKSGTKKVKC
jgi:hypothetical protein